jgi:glutaminyl-tRNA synthetase
MSDATSAPPRSGGASSAASSTGPAEGAPADAARSSNFIRQAVEADLAERTYATRRWAGRPALAEDHLRGAIDPARIRTRFPPEPNGYLHIGHAKSISLNFGLAADYGGRCHMRFDDTNPVKEEQEYVDGILDAVRWLGYRWDDGGEDNLYFASDYFGWMYRFAQWLIESGHAYVDSQSADEMRETRGTLTESGRDSPYRDRPAAESQRLFAQMREGKHAEGSHVLRARIDMSSPNINLRDPVLYRIRFAEHHRTGNDWCIYPMYDYAHPLSDAVENITHSICTLEFEDHRPFYDWVLERVADGGFFQRPVPRQIEFARLNLTYTVTSKRRLQDLVASGTVDGWDDPRMPTIVGLRRRGYTPEAVRLFSERIGVSKANQWIDPGVLEQALRDDLDAKAPRATAVLDPLKLVLVNYPENLSEPCMAPVHPQDPSRGVRQLPFTRELWIEREDFAAQPPKGFFRLFPGNRVRLRFGYVVLCTGFESDEQGRVTRVLAEYLPDSRSGTAGADAYKVKGNIHWVSASHGIAAEIRLYDRLFSEPYPDAGGRDYRTALNPNAKRVLQAWLEPSLAHARPGDRFQFERHGYFVADRLEHSSERPVFNRAVTLRDSWQGGGRR